jgi:ankyrin repeat protein|eukprot:COSAG01_NODE_2668_length_7278_cov_187.051957_8_plen_197_part_00
MSYTSSDLMSDLIKHAKAGDDKEIKRILDKAAFNRKVQAAVDVNAKRGGWTVLWAAAINGHAKVIQLLLDRKTLLKKDGLKVNKQNKTGNTALHLAVDKGHTEIVRRLTDCEKINLGVKNDHGNTALHLAVDKGHIEIVEMLLNKGVKLDTKNNRDETALAIAKKQGHTAIVTLIKNKTAGYVHILLFVRVAPVSH